MAYRTPSDATLCLIYSPICIKYLVANEAIWGCPAPLTYGVCETLGNEEARMGYHALKKEAEKEVEGESDGADGARKKHYFRVVGLQCPKVLNEKMKNKKYRDEK